MLHMRKNLKKKSNGYCSGGQHRAVCHSALKILFAFILAGILAAGTAHAKELYVDSQAGNDSVSYTENNANNPWRTIGRAAWGSTNRANPNSTQAARAGDTVIVRQGIYSASGSGGVRYEPFYNPVNNGSSGSEIIFMANGNVELRYNGTEGRPLIGTSNRSYIIWDGFTLNENYIDVHRDTGPVVIWGSSHVTVRNLRITGTNQGWGDNHNAIRIEGSDHAAVQNCYMSGFSEDHGAGVMTYTSSFVLMEHNEVTNCQHGLYVKGENPGPFTIRYNYIHDSILKGIRLSGLQSGGAEVYQNVVHDVGEGIDLTALGSDGPQNVRIINNTIDSTNHSHRGSIFMGDPFNAIVNMECKNNIITNSSNAGIHVGVNYILEELDSDYNMLYNNRSAFQDEYSNMSLSNWQSSHSKDLNSYAQNPSYVNMSGHNYELNTGSPARGAGIDVLDLDNDGSTRDAINLGAYVTGNEVIGLTSSIDDTPDTGTASLPAPSNLLVN